MKIRFSCGFNSLFYLSKILRGYSNLVEYFSIRRNLSEVHVCFWLRRCSPDLCSSVLFTRMVSPFHYLVCYGEDFVPCSIL